MLFGCHGVLALGIPEELERGAGTPRLSDSGVSGKDIACKKAEENFGDPLRGKVQAGEDRHSPMDGIHQGTWRRRRARIFPYPPTFSQTKSGFKSNTV